MDFVVGSSATLFAVLLYAWAYGKINAPVPPKWTSNHSIASVIALTITGMVPVGGGFLLRGAFAPVSASSVYGWGVVAAAVVVAVVLVPRLSAPARLPRVSNVVPLPTGPAVHGPDKLAA